jgi:hypothetical protein
MSSLAATLAKARQLRDLTSHQILPDHPTYAALTSVDIPPFDVSSPPDVSAALSSLGLTPRLVQKLQQLYIQHVDSYRQHAQSEYFKTADRLVSTMQGCQHFFAGLQSNIDLLLQAYVSKYRNLSYRLQRDLLRNVTARMTRERDCQPDRPAQLGKSFSKVRLASSFFLLLFVASHPFDIPFSSFI